MTVWTRRSARRDGKNILAAKDGGTAAVAEAHVCGRRCGEGDKLLSAVSGKKKQ